MKTMTFTPLAKKLIFVCCAIVLGRVAYNEFRFQFQFARLGNPSIQYVSNLNVQGSLQEKRAIPRLVALLRHPYANVRRRAGWNLDRFGYQPANGEELFHYALASSQFHLIPFQWEEVVRFFLSSPELNQKYPGIPDQQVANWADPRIHEIFRNILRERLERIGEFADLSEAEQERESTFTAGMLYGLGVMYSAGDIPLFREFAKHPSESVRHEALRRLVYFRDYEVIPLLLHENKVWDGVVRMKYKLDGIIDEAVYILPDDQWLTLIINDIQENGTGRYFRFRNGIYARLDHPEILRQLTDLYHSNPEADGLKGLGFEEIFQQMNEKIPPIFPGRSFRPAARSAQTSDTSSPAEILPPAEIERQIEELKRDMLQALRDDPNAARRSDFFRDRIETLARTDHPDLLSVVIAAHCFQGPGYVNTVGFEYLGRLGHPHAYLLMCRRLNRSRFFHPDIYNGLKLLQDPRAIPELLPHLPNVRTFRSVMSLLESLGWTPSNEEEAAYQIIFQRAPEDVDAHRELLHRFLVSQMDSTELRRRDFATWAVLELDLSDLFPHLVRMLEKRPDGRIATMMHQSGNPDLQAAAEKWLSTAPFGTQLSMPRVY